MVGRNSYGYITQAALIRAPHQKWPIKMPHTRPARWHSPIGYFIMVNGQNVKKKKDFGDLNLRL